MTPRVCLLKTPQEIEHLRRVADECDYDRERIARVMHVSLSVVNKWQSRRWLTRNGEGIRQAITRRNAERAMEALRETDGDIERAAVKLGISPEATRSRLYAAGLRVGDAPSPIVKQCCACGKTFRTRWGQQKACSPECVRAKARASAKRSYRIRHGLDPHAIYEREAVHAKYRAALIECYGSTTRAGALLGKNRRTIEAWVRKNDMREFVMQQRARERDPEHVYQLLQENDWNIRRAAAAIGRKDDWIRKVMRRAGREDLLLCMPCPACGKMVQRKGKRRTACSPECKRLHHNAYKRAHKKKQKQAS